MKIDKNFRYTGMRWNTLQDACRDLRLDYIKVKRYQKRHRIADNKVLKAYIKSHCFCAKGLIFDSMDKAARAYGLTHKMIKPYLKMGYSIDFACYLVLMGKKEDFFNV